jgi:hypothetical protein
MFAKNRGRRFWPTLNIKNDMENQFKNEEKKNTKQKKHQVYYKQKQKTTRKIVYYYRDHVLNDSF